MDADGVDAGEDQTDQVFDQCAARFLVAGSQSYSVVVAHAVLDVAALGVVQAHVPS